MRSQTALKIVLILGILSFVGAAIAFRLGTPAVRIGEQVGYVWVVAAAFLLEPIATQLFPTRLPQIAIVVALLSAAVGALCIVRYSTEHIALSLSMVAIFWQVSEGLLIRRPWLLNKTPGEIFMHFKTTRAKPRPPMANVLGHGSTVLFMTSIVCLFTITTW
jgi:hypothetical protein